MKKIFITTILATVLLSTAVNAQTNTFPSTGAVGIGTLSPNASSLLEIKSTKKGVLISRMTKNQRDSIAAPATGLLIYQTNSTPGFYYYNGSAWKPVTPVAGTSGAWLLTGNAGTDSSLNFIGTKDAHPLAFRVNNKRSGWIDFTGNNNTSFGYQGLLANTTGFYNTAIGYNSLKANIAGGRNTAVGAYTLLVNTAENNTAIGTYALEANKIGKDNVATGVNALAANTKGNFNTATGSNTLYTNTEGIENTATGYGALFSNLTGNDNAAFGKYALYNNNANNNSAYGFNAMFFNASGSGNTAIGATALQNNTSGSNNVAVGNYALGNNVTGSNNTAIGFNAQVGTGAVLTNATAIGSNATVDISNAVVIGNNANVGIGTTSPAAPLHIVGTASNNTLNVTTAGTVNDPSILLARNSGAKDRFKINVRGNGGSSWLSIWDDTNGSPDNGINVKGNMVGIGTKDPGYVLDVAGRMRIQSGGATSGTWLMNVANTVDAAFLGMVNDTYVGMYGTGAGWGLVMNTTSGNVGIGTFNPAYKLSVNGSIQSKEVRVETGWSDYVFEKDYKLKSMEELEQFINKHKHLPGIAPAAEVEKNGLNVGEMNKAMMEKIEELTLYVILLSKENKKLQNEIDSLKK